MARYVDGRGCRATRSVAAADPASDPRRGGACSSDGRGCLDARRACGERARSGAAVAGTPLVAGSSVGRPVDVFGTACHLGRCPFGVAGMEPPGHSRACGAGARVSSAGAGPTVPRERLFPRRPERDPCPVGSERGRAGRPGGGDGASRGLLRRGHVGCDPAEVQARGRRARQRDDTGPDHLRGSRRRPLGHAESRRGRRPCGVPRGSREGSRARRAQAGDRGGTLSASSSAQGTR